MTCKEEHAQVQIDGFDIQLFADFQLEFSELIVSDTIGSRVTVENELIVLAKISCIDETSSLYRLFLFLFHER